MSSDARTPAAAPPRVHRLPSFVRTVVVPREARGTPLERVEWLTPYSAETIAEDVRRAGPGARLEVTVSSTASDTVVEAVGSLFGWLRDEGFEVVVRRDPPRAED